MARCWFKLTLSKFLILQSWSKRELSFRTIEPLSSRPRYEQIDPLIFRAKSIIRVKVMEHDRQRFCPIPFFVRSVDQGRLSYCLHCIEDNEFSNWIEGLFYGILLSSVRIPLISASRNWEISIGHSIMIIVITWTLILEYEGDVLLLRAQIIIFPIAKPCVSFTELVWQILILGGPFRFTLIVSGSSGNTGLTRRIVLFIGQIIIIRGRRWLVESRI
jgi:hypothetical protein